MAIKVAAEQDEETQLSSFYLRQYDNRIGRWTTPDPYNQYWSPYLGMGNAPNMMIDPNGGVSGPPSFWTRLKAFVTGGTISNSGRFVFNTGQRVAGRALATQALKTAGTLAYANAGRLSSNNDGLPSSYQKPRVRPSQDGQVGGITVPYISGGIESSAQALRHYFNGNGASATLGNSTVNALILSDGFQMRHQRIISGKTTSLAGNFSVDLTRSIFHVGRTNIDYSINCESGDCTVTYDLFVRDGFWDVDFIDENILGRLGLPSFEPDGLGPNLERSGGTPYPYTPIRGTHIFPNPGY